MADELKISGTLSFIKGTAPGDLKIVRTLSSQTFDVSGTSGFQNIISLATTDETLALGDVATIGYCLFHNLDATNYISIGSDGTLYPLKLKAGEWAIARWNAAAIHAKSNSSACNFEYVVIPD